MQLVHYIRCSQRPVKLYTCPYLSSLLIPLFYSYLIETFHTFLSFFFSFFTKRNLRQYNNAFSPLHFLASNQLYLLFLLLSFPNLFPFPLLSILFLKFHNPFTTNNINVWKVKYSHLTTNVNKCIVYIYLSI